MDERESEVRAGSLPVRGLGSEAYTWVELVTGIQVAVETGECRFRSVKMTDVVFGRIFGAPCIEEFEQTGLQCQRVGAFAQDVVAMEDVTEKVAVVERLVDLSANLLRQNLMPVSVVLLKSDIERKDVFNLQPAQSSVAYGGARRHEAVKKCFGSFVISAAEEIAAARGE